MPLTAHNIPVIVITSPCGTPAPWSAFSRPTSTGRASSMRRREHRARQAPISRGSPGKRIRSSRPAPSPPVDVCIDDRRTGDVLVLKVPPTSSLDGLRALLPSAAATCQLAMADDSVEQWALESHFHAFLARAHKDGEPLRLVLQECA